MKALISLVALLALGGGGYYVFVVLPGTDQGEQGGPAPVTEDEKEPEGNGALEAKPINVRKKEKRSYEEDRRWRWTQLRPSRERLVPDPDKIGPCPPVDEGGMAAPVIRKYRDPANGFATWVHDDGSYTVYHPTGSFKDPKTGEKRANMMVTTYQPTEPMDIHPDDLPRAAPGTGAKKEAGK